MSDPIMVFVALAGGKLASVATSRDGCKVECFDAGLNPRDVTILSQPLRTDLAFWDEIRRMTM